MDIFDIIRGVKDREARANASKLPDADEFREIAEQFQVGAITGGGVKLNAEQCRLLSQTFATLSVSVIATPTD